ncbi:MAG: helix-turn-helix transcriptional regulator [Lachnospiraceae bacterium]|nr:helix-turn-helix transcriptional regulator [Lachnospiraceae bacterium]
MTTSDMIRELCEKMNISLAELCRRIGQTPQNFNKKLKRGTVSFKEMVLIAEALNVEYEHAFVLPDGKKISINKGV